MRKEIEVKAKVKDLEQIANKLRDLGCKISEPIVQYDKVFVDDHYGQYDAFQPGKNVLRIRNANGTYTFTVKQPQKNQLDAIEHEVEISNPHEMEEALLMMGFHQSVEIHKVRRKTYVHGWEVCLDDVRDLGYFVEVEKITDDEDPGAVQKELFTFLETLGIHKQDQVMDGYDGLVYRKINQTSDDGKTA